MIGEVDLVRALGLAGIRSAVVVQPGNPARYSRHAVSQLEWRDPWRDAVRLVDELCAWAAAQKTAPVLFYDGDWDLQLVSRHRERLAAAGFLFVVPGAELVEDLLDKARFQRLAASLGLPVPRAIVATASTANDVDLAFPLVAKPLTRQHVTWQPLTSAKAIRVSDRRELLELLQRFARAGVDALVQEEVPGPEDAIESYHAYVRSDGTVAGEFTGKKVRTYPHAFGYSTALVTTDTPDVRELGREVIERVALRGVAKLDFKRTPDDDLVLLEINARFNLWHHLGAVAGVNLPELVFRDLLGLPHREVAAARPGVRWCSVRHDRLAAREQGVPLTRWLWSVLCSDATSGFALDDPLPLPRALAWRGRHALVHRIAGLTALGRAREA